MAELHTKRSDGVDLILYFPAGKVTIGAIAAIGESQVFNQSATVLMLCGFDLQSLNSCGDTDLISLIIECSMREMTVLPCACGGLAALPVGRLCGRLPTPPLQYFAATYAGFSKSTLFPACRQN